MFRDDFKARADSEPEQWNEGIPVTNPVHVVIARLFDQRSGSFRTSKKTVQNARIYLRNGSYFSRRSWASASPIGSNLVRMNQRLNQPRDISSTARRWRPSKAAARTGTRISFPMRRCSRHWPTLQASCLGCQLELASDRASCLGLRRHRCTHEREKDVHHSKVRKEGENICHRNSVNQCHSGGHQK